MRSSNGIAAMLLIATRVPKVMCKILDQSLFIASGHHKKENCVVKIDCRPIILTKKLPFRKVGTKTCKKEPPCNELKLLNSVLSSDLETQKAILLHPVVGIFLHQKWLRARIHLITSVVLRKLQKEAELKQIKAQVAEMYNMECIVYSWKLPTCIRNLLRRTLSITAKLERGVSNQLFFSFKINDPKDTSVPEELKLAAKPVVEKLRIDFELIAQFSELQDFNKYEPIILSKKLPFRKAGADTSQKEPLCNELKLLYSILSSDLETQKAILLHPVVGIFLHQKWLRARIHLITSVVLRKLQKEAELKQIKVQVAEMYSMESIVYSWKLPTCIRNFLRRALSITDKLERSISNQLLFTFKINDPKDTSVPEELKLAAKRLVEKVHSEIV
ncbi:unnamed protein product [Allacma fusca]|uniref:Uncharacterized protein n=1 Tax=Allacma fusca TaxID=39272 RepID=A0A8J2J9I5_9HEXA|nr:unnamed protein product [Allacma fusca]